MMRTVWSRRTRTAWLTATLLAGMFVIPAGGPSMQAMAQEDDAREAESYAEGRRLLDEREWERAERAFDRVIRRNGSRAEGALYWKAYAQWKQGRGSEALDSLSDLLGSHPGGRWEDDARALRLEIRQAGGNAVVPEGETDEDLKLLALQSLMHQDPGQAIPILKGILEGDRSPEMKKKALFVLMQLGSPEARGLVTEIASGEKHPELRREALRHVAMMGDAQSHAVLQRIYETTDDPEIKREILRDTVMWSGSDAASEMLTEAIHQEKDPELRRTAIQVLGMKGRKSDLMQLYKGESSVETREAVLQAFLMAGGRDQLVEIVKSETNPELRRHAIHTLGAAGGEESRSILMGIYEDRNEDIETRETVLQALMMMGDDSALIAIARKETDPRLKKKAVQVLSMMGSEQARAFLMEILEN